jgi:DNA-binding XRE family transcriptional regulator
MDHSSVFAGRKRLIRIDRHFDRGDELMASIREEFRLNREELRLTREAYERHFELSRREHQATQAALGNLRDVCRSLVVALEENTRTLRDLRTEIRAQTEGLMHVLDELRGRGPGGEPATS